MNRTVLATAPCRVDLAGGTLDIWPLGLLHPGARTVNVAVDVEVRASLAPRAASWAVVQEGARIEVVDRRELLRRPETALVGCVAEHFDLPPVEVTLASASPRGAGLGASSALAVALIAAAERMLGAPVSEVAGTVHLARDLEARLMGLPTGIQDHYPALLGGALEIRHEPGGERVRALAVDLDALGRSLVLVDSGGSHLSAANNFEVVSRRLLGDSDTTARLQAIADVATAMARCLDENDLARAGRLMTEEWKARRELAPVVATPEIERILLDGAEAGAWGGKVCGAGGGGCVVMLAADREQLVSRLGARGHSVVAGRPTASALRVVSSDDAPRLGPGSAAPRG
jgi:D-glycero-alpha-D-manno-heptose-7-phosphate kinase